MHPKQMHRPNRCDSPHSELTSLCITSFITPSLQQVKMQKSIKLNPTVSLRRLQELKCQQCGQIFYTYPQLKRHKRLHSRSQKQFLCDVCGVTSTTRYFHHQHLRSHGRHPYQCSYCSKSFPKLKTLKRHQSIHAKEQTLLYQTLCPQSVTSQEFQVSATSSGTTQNGTLYPGLQLKLEDPGHSTVFFFEDTAGTPLPVLSTTLNTHLQLKGEKSIHNDDGPFACQMCGSHFTSCYLLDEHQQRRTGKYPCCVCGRNYKTLSGLWDHALLHDKKPDVSDQPLCHSGTALVEPKVEPLETPLSSDISLTNNPHHSFQLKPEDPGPSPVFLVEAPPGASPSSLPVITATVDTLTPRSAPPPLSKDRVTFLPARVPRHSTALTPSSQSPGAPPSVGEPATRTPPQLLSGPTPAIFSSFKLTSAFLEVKWNYKLLQERATSKKC